MLEGSPRDVWAKTPKFRVPHLQRYVYPWMAAAAQLYLRSMTFLAAHEARAAFGLRVAVVDFIGSRV